MGRNLPDYTTAVIRTVAPWSVNNYPNALYTKAEVTATETRFLYYETSDAEFNSRFNNHNRSFRHKRYLFDTELSKHNWKSSNDSSVRTEKECCCICFTL